MSRLIDVVMAVVLVFGLALAILCLAMLFTGLFLAFRGALS